MITHEDIFYKLACKLMFYSVNCMHTVREIEDILTIPTSNCTGPKINVCKM